MQPITQYIVAAVLFVLGLAAIGGATFGRKRNQRLVLAGLGIVLWAATLILYSNAASIPTAEPTPSPVAAQPTATATPEPPPTAVIEPTATPVPIPDFPGRLAFHSDRTGQLEIWSMNANGTELRQLTNSPERDLEPDWSPDSQQIVFSSGRDDPENVQLYLMDADGSNQRRLMEFMPADQLGARWSPDGQWILFHSNMAVDGQPWIEIYKVRADGTDLVRLTDPPFNNFRPDWSPDGSRIVFVSDRDGNRQLYVTDANGGNPVRVTENSANDNRPGWSPDGTTIVFDSSRDGGASVYLVDAPSVVAAGPTESTVNLLTFPGFTDESAAWASAGSHVVFSSDRDSETVQNWELYMMNSDGTDVVRLTYDPALDRFPSWTP